MDSSRDMNDLAQLLLQGGRGTNLINLKGTFYRQFLPANNVNFINLEVIRDFKFSNYISDSL